MCMAKETRILTIKQQMKIFQSEIIAYLRKTCAAS